MMPIYYITDSIPNTIEYKVDELGLKFAFWQINPSVAEIRANPRARSAVMRVAEKL